MGSSFFGVGPFELLLIAVLALIFIGPQRLPGVISQVMSIIRDLRGYADEIQAELKGEFSELQGELSGIQQELQTVSRDVNQFAQDVAASTDAIARETQQTIDVFPSGVVTPVGAAEPAKEFPALPPLTPPVANGVSAAPEGQVTPAAEDERPLLRDYRPGG